MKVSFDVISDLHLNSDEDFNWQGRSSSLYCVVAGNVAADLETLKSVLLKLASCYHCVFYIPGKLEFQNCGSISERLLELALICKSANNLVLLYNHVCVVDGVALLGAICDYGEIDILDENYSSLDYLYLQNSIDRLQKHKDVRNIICITARVPTKELYCGMVQEQDNFVLDLVATTKYDTEKKVTYWIYGNGADSIEQKIDDITFVSNPNCVTPYYPVRVLV